MSENDVVMPITAQNTPSQEFTAYCESEFERRLNSGSDFDEHQYRKAMMLVKDKLEVLEQGSDT